LRREQLTIEPPIPVENGPPLPSLAIHLGRTKTSSGEEEETVYLTGRPVGPSHSDRALCLRHEASRLLQLIEDLEKRGVHFRSLRDPIDTSTPQGMFFLQVLGAVAQLERALIAERTKAGIKAAKARGKLPGNPGLRERRPEAVKAVSKAREKLCLDELISSAQTWLPTVRQLRPQHSWDNVVRVLNRRGHDWTVERLRRAVHRAVRENLAGRRVAPRRIIL
jgi:hypothetical protein